MLPSIMVVLRLALTLVAPHLIVSVVLSAASAAASIHSEKAQTRGLVNVAGRGPAGEGTGMPDLILDLAELQNTVHVEDVPLGELECALEEDCMAPQAYSIRALDSAWQNVTRRLLRFTTNVYNNGSADFRPDAPREQWTWHQCHRHYHSFKVFSIFEIFDGNGTEVAMGQKASFCLEDTVCDDNVQHTFNCYDFGDQGVTVGCADTYGWDLDCQWVDISELKPGRYSFKVSVNFQYTVKEERFDNNAVRCVLDYFDHAVHVHDCAHEHPDTMERQRLLGMSEDAGAGAGAGAGAVVLLPFLFICASFSTLATLMYSCT